MKLIEITIIKYNDKFYEYFSVVKKLLRRKYGVKKDVNYTF